MKLLTQAQITWLISKKIEVGGEYTFPMFGFNVYEKPSVLSRSSFMSTNPWTKSLIGEYFKVSEIKDGFCRGNFASKKPNEPDMYMREDELASRDYIQVAFLFAICILPMLVYNVGKAILPQFKI